MIKNHIKIVCNEILIKTKQNIEHIETKIKKRNENIKINELINPISITKGIQKFFTTNQLSQIMEETNPLGEITHKRKITSFGLGAVDRKRTNMNVREIHPSHFGRLCPIETSEGKNAGLVLSLAKNIKLNKYGFIETPFYL